MTMAAYILTVGLAAFGLVSAPAAIVGGKGAGDRGVVVQEGPEPLRNGEHPFKVSCAPVIAQGSRFGAARTCNSGSSAGPIPGYGACSMR